MNQQKNKKTALLLFLVTVLVAIAAFFVLMDYNRTVSEIDKQLIKFSFLFFIFIIINLATFSSLLVLFLKKEPMTIVEMNQHLENEKEIDSRAQKQLEEEERKKEKLRVKNLIQTITDENLRKLKTTEEYCKQLLSNIGNVFEIVEGIVYLVNSDNKFTSSCAYALNPEDTISEFEFGEGLTGQVAKNRQFEILKNIPRDFISAESGLGNSTVAFLILFPILHANKTIGVVELATFQDPDKSAEDIFMGISEIIGEDFGKINAI